MKMPVHSPSTAVQTKRFPSPFSTVWALTLTLIASAPTVRAETLEIYAAGSLREVVTTLAEQAGGVAGVEIKPTFGGSGALRERIESGESPDLFLSADMGSPRKLGEKGRSVVSAIPFARNRMCLIAPSALKITQQNLVDRLLAEDLRLKASTPIVDPAGDYAVAIFDRIDASHKGAGQRLREKTQNVAEATKSLQPMAGHSAGASLFLEHRIDMMVSYCSGVAAIEKEVPELTALPFPATLEPQPVYGMSVLSDKPAALRLALFLLSEKGQQIVRQAGLLPLVDAVP